MPFAYLRINMLQIKRKEKRNTFTVNLQINMFANIIVMPVTLRCSYFDESVLKDIKIHILVISCFVLY